MLGKNTPEKAIKDFERILNKVSNRYNFNNFFEYLLSKGKSRKFKVSYDVLSTGTPTITDSSLNSQLEKNADHLNIPYIMMPSYPGQDTGFVPADSIAMLFCPSTGGSHNPNESTHKKCIQYSAILLADTCKQLLKQPFKEQLHSGTDDKTTKALMPANKMLKALIPNENQTSTR